ncbi:MAG: DUF4167 domain-containing protein [Pseudolabrys sp.]|jgi:hypothetical protein
MRNGQKRMRGRGGHRKSQNPLTRVYESNGPDVKIRGTANHIAEKYVQLARDAQSSGDPVAAENYYQHAEHYFRLIAAAQEQYRQQNPYYQQQQPQQQSDDGYGEESDEGQPYVNEPSFVARDQQPQPYLPRDAQPFPPRDQQVTRAPQQPDEGATGLPAFITGGQPQPSANGHDQSERGQDGQGNGAQGNQERYGSGYRRRRRHRGGGARERADMASAQGSGGEEPQPGE